jgi:acylphosphatase
MPTKLTKPKKPVKSITSNKKVEMKPSDPTKRISKFKVFKEDNINHVNNIYATEITMNLANTKTGNQRPTKLVKNNEAIDPTIKRLKEFLISKAAIQILKKAYVSGKYVCVDFATDLHNLAEQSGIRCGLVVVVYTHGDGHVMVAFEVKNKGLTFVDFTQLANYDLDTFIGKKPIQSKDDFFKIITSPHYTTFSGNRKRNIETVDIIW